MLTISLDEQGDFEGLKETGNEKEPLFIGGIVYDDGDEEYDLENEKRRINLYLKAICKNVGATYPKDLHVGGNNQKKVRSVKQKITETLGSFLTEGKCEFENNEFSEILCNRMKPRKGKYYIFALTKYGTAKKELMPEKTSILIREDYASNLYVHMAEEIVERIIFHNPVLKSIQNVRLNLATRRAVLEGEQVNEKAKQYIALGYKEDLDPQHKEEGKRKFLLTNADIYRTAIEREMMDTGKKEIHVERIGVNSIYYGSESDNYRMEFLYLADIICTVLGFKVDTSSGQALVKEMKERADRYSGHSDNLIFVYDALDTIYKRAWHCLEEKDYFQTLHLCYCGMQKESPYQEFYSKVWFPRLIERLKEETDVDTFGLALRKYYLSTRKNDLKQDELVFVYEIFEEMLEHMKFKRNEEKAVLYDLYDAGISTYCHIGNSIRAKECFEKCKPYAKYVEIERYLRSRNKMVVFLTDMFLFEDALEIAQENIIFQQELLNVRELIFDEKEVSKEYGISLSQLGQISSSLRLLETEKIFLDALEQMGDENSSDYLQTESYLLHYYLEIEEKQKYDVRAEKYFGGNKNLGKQLSYLIREGGKGREGKYSMKFALYVYIKALYRFHVDEISENLLEKLYCIEDTIRKNGGEKASEQINGHPWEIIYKYLSLIALKYGNVEKAEEFANKMKNILNYHGFTLDMICIFGEIEIALKSREMQRFAELLKVAENLIKENTIEIYEKIDLLPEGEDRYNFLREHVVNFMYR